MKWTSNKKLFVPQIDTSKSQGMSTLVSDYCGLLEKQKGHACSHLVEKILSSDDIFVYGEFLSVASVLALKDDSNYVKTFNTLTLFAYGTFTQYTRDGSAQYLSLNAHQTKKLRMLTLVSIAESNKLISLSELATETGLTDTRHLEDLIIETIYAGLISGEIDQRGKVLRVSRCVSRDVPPHALDSLIDKFKAWREKCDEVSRQVESSSQTLKTERVAAMLEQNQLNVEIQRAKLSQKDTKVLGPEDVDRMEEGEDRDDDVDFEQQRIPLSHMNAKTSAIRSAKRMKGHSVASGRSGV